MNRREFLQMMAAAYLVGFSDKSSSKNLIDYNIPFTSDLRLLHITDTHAQLAPTYFREPNINLGTGKIEMSLHILLAINFSNIIL